MFPAFYLGILYAECELLCDFGGGYFNIRCIEFECGMLYSEMVNSLAK